MKLYFLALKNSFTFSGRSTRKEFWTFVLFDTILTISALFIDFSVITNRSLSFDLPIFSIINWLIPSIARLSAVSRRLHDTDTSFKFFVQTTIVLAILGGIAAFFPWIIILHFIIVIGFFIKLAEASDQNNNYGPAPIGVKIQEPEEEPSKNNKTSDSDFFNTSDEMDNIISKMNMNKSNLHKECKSCGSELHPDDNFCKKCGTPK